MGNFTKTIEKVKCNSNVLWIYGVGRVTEEMPSKVRNNIRSH